MVIDSHAHVMLPPERQLQWMAEAKVDYTILFSSMVHPELAPNREGVEEELNKLYNILNGTINPHHERICAIQELVDIIKSAPEKYIGFGPIPLGLSYHDSLEWIDRYILANKLRGIGELAPGTGQIPQLEPLFRASHDTGNLPLWVHTFFPLTFEDIKELLNLAKRYPTVPLILGHLGGIHWLNTLKAVKDIPNVYLDLSASFTTIAPALAIQEYPERTLFGSDSPYCSPLTARTIIEQTIKDRYILEQVLGGNISRLLSL